MAERFVDIFTLLGDRIDYKRVSPCGLRNMFVNLTSIYAVFSMTADEGPSVQIKSVGGPMGFPMVSAEAADVAAKMVVSVVQMAADGPMEEVEGVMRRVLKEAAEENAGA
jgi:hypothetical protein